MVLPSSVNKDSLTKVTNELLNQPSKSTILSKPTIPSPNQLSPRSSVVGNQQPINLFHIQSVVFSKVKDVHSKGPKEGYVKPISHQKLHDHKHSGDSNQEVLILMKEIEELREQVEKMTVDQRANSPLAKRFASLGGVL